MKVPLLDLRRHGKAVDDELREAFNRVLVSGHYILGPEVDTLEKECATYVGAKHAIGVSSGTDALLLALMALGVGPGDDVVCPTYTFFATAGTIARLGARPVFTDIDPASYNAGLEQIEPRLTAKTKVIMPVHLFGQCGDMQPLAELARSRRIHLVEDAAQAIGARFRAQSAGTSGAFGCFSFFPSKNLGALGDAGLVTSDDDGLAEKARIVRAHGSKPKYYHRIVGGNFRIDALQAALIRVKLKRLDEYTAARQKNADLYRKLFADTGLVGNKLVLPAVVGSRHIYNQFILRVTDGSRDRLRTWLAEKGVGTEVYYPVPMHMQECFASLGHKEGDFPVSEAAARETLAIPIFPELTAEEIGYVVAEIVRFFS
jgi:dTDP-4-amino-4,6-dideoxygalactose transaminase